VTDGLPTLDLADAGNSLPVVMSVPAGQPALAHPEDTVDHGLGLDPPAPAPDPATLDAGAVTEAASPTPTAPDHSAIGARLHDDHLGARLAWPAP
jgi:hypothetical protein